MHVRPPAARAKQNAVGTLFRNYQLRSHFCTTWLSVCTNGENDVRSLQVASARHDEFVFTGFLACYWFGIS